MRITTGLILALVLGSAGALAQEGPEGKMQGAPGAHERGAGAEHGPAAQERSAPRSERGSEQPSSRGDHDSANHAQQNREEKGEKSRAAEKERAEKEKSQRTEGENKRKTEDRAAERSRTEKEKSAQPSSEGQASGEQGRAAEKGEAERTGKEARTGEAKEAAKHVELTGNKRDRLKTAFREAPNAKHRTDVHADLTVGHRLPRDFDFVTVPRAVVEIVPEYRDYLFAYIDDDYVICDPETYEIVSVIPAGGGPSYASGEESGRCSERLSLSADDRDLIVRAVEREGPSRKVDVSHLTVGWSVPRDVELQRFPEQLVSQVRELSSCRYFMAEDQIAVVNPDEDKVVAVINRG